LNKVQYRGVRELLISSLLTIFLVILFRYDDIKGGFFQKFIDFNTTNGYITKSKITPHWSIRGGSGHKLMIEYKYKVEGKKYTSNKVSFGNTIFFEEEQANKIASKFFIDKNTTVYYEKSNPNFSVLILEENSNNEILFVLSIFGIISLVLTIILYKK
jgi:hypothetical protein